MNNETVNGKALLAQRLLNKIKLKNCSSRLFGLATADEQISIKDHDEALKIVLSKKYNSQYGTVLKLEDLLDPLSFVKNLGIQIKDYPNSSQLDEIAIGLTLSFDIFAVAERGTYDEIAIVIDYGIIDLVEKIFIIIIDHYMTNPYKGKIECTGKEINRVIHTYCIEKRFVKFERRVSREVKAISIECAYTFFVFLILHEIGHVVLGHFSNLSSDQNTDSEILFLQNQELEADAYAFSEWYFVAGLPNLSRSNGKATRFLHNLLFFNFIVDREISAVFLPISVSICFSILQIVDRYNNIRTNTHPTWELRAKQLKELSKIKIDKRQANILDATEKIVEKAMT
jgi:hypothetical protein